MAQGFWRRRWVQNTLLCLLLLLAVHVSLTVGRMAFMWFLLVLALAALACAVRTRHDWVVYGCMSFMAVCLVMAGMEYHARATSYYGNRVVEKRWPYEPDADLGYISKRQAGAYPSRVSMGGEVLYDVVYTLDADGWRVTPQHPGAKRAAIFLGDSWTAGEGVNDADTFPCKLAQLLGAEWQVYNRAVPGYGPHSVLAQLESGRLDALLQRYDQVEVFFLTIPSHEWRMAGYASWDEQGPRYVLENGRLERRGNFDTDYKRNWLWGQWGMLVSAFRESYLCQLLFIDWRFQHGAMVDVQCAAVRAMQQYVEGHSRNGRFTLLGFAGMAEVLRRCADAGVNVLDATPALTLGLRDPRYSIPHDMHPSPLAYTHLAEFLACHLRGEAGARPQ